MFGLGWQETAVIFVLALLLFGPKKLPELGKNLAKALGEFRRASNELKDTWHREMAAVERETQDIKKEAESWNSTVSTTTPDTTYDYNYEYGGYGYPESGEASAQPQTAADASGSAETGAASGSESATAAAAEPAAVENHGAALEDAPSEPVRTATSDAPQETTPAR